MQKRYRFGTFNVKNLASPGFKFYGRSYDKNEYKKKIAWTGQTIHDMNPHLIGFQEVWNDEALKESLEVVKKISPRRKYDTVAFGGEDGEAARVALATRLPVVEAAQVIRKFPEPVSFADKYMSMTATEFRRPVLRIVVELSGYPVTAFVAHLKSKRPIFDKPEDAPFAPDDDLLSADLFSRTVGTLRALLTRAAEAAALRALVINEAQENKQPVIFMGDLNDGLDSVTTDMVEGEEPFRYYYRLKKPGTDEYYSREEDWEIKRRLWDVKLYSAQRIQSRRSLRDPIFTHIYNGRYESLDHILVSEEFYYRNSHRIGDVEYLHCFNDHLTDESIGGDTVFAHASDHAPLVATIAVKSESD